MAVSVSAGAVRRGEWRTPGAATTQVTRDMTGEVVLDIRLSLVSHILSVTSFSTTSTSFAAQSNVLVISDSFLSQAIEDGLFLVSEPIDPGVHKLHHFTLNGRVLVVEIWMKP